MQKWETLVRSFQKTTQNCQKYHHRHIFAWHGLIKVKNQEKDRQKNMQVVKSMSE